MPHTLGETLKFGAKPSPPDRRDLQLNDVLKVELPPVPTKPYGYGRLWKDWKILGNDRYGDCVFASGDHQTMLYNKLAGRTVTFTNANALDDYGAVTGFDPSTGANDNGTVIRDALNYRRQTGLVDSSKLRHKIDAYASIDVNWDTVQRCIWTFGAVEIGFDVPSSAESDFNNGTTWDDVNDSNILGGHDVPLVGSEVPAERVTFITWGRRTVMTRRFFARYVTECWVPLSKEAMRASGFNTRHIDWAHLSDYLNGL